MKTIRLLLLSVSIFISQSSFAQFENFLLGGKQDANLLLNSYMTPVMKGIGYGFNNGWYNTAKPHETLGFDLTISFNAAFVPVADQTFEFVNSDYNNTRISSGSTTLPTVMGNNTTTVLENFVQIPNGPEVSVGTYNAPNGLGDDIKPYTFNQLAVPSPIIQGGIGIIKGTEIKVRWMPTINNQDFSFKYFGIGGMHSLSQWIPVIKGLKFLDISAFVGWTTIAAEYAIPTGNIPGAGQRATFDINTITYQLLVSAHVSVITGYIGIGADNFNTTFKMLGTYDLYPSSPIPTTIEDPIAIEQSGTGGFRSTMGLRLKLAILTLHADYTFREYNTLNVGLGFSFR